MYVGVSGPEMLEVLCNSIMPGEKPRRATLRKTRSGPLYSPSNAQQLPQAGLPAGDKAGSYASRISVLKSSRAI